MNINLLRPVVFYELKVGEVLWLYSGLSPTVAYKAPTFAVLKFEDGSEGTFGIFPLETIYKILPLCWVEDKPVYRGDVLYRPAVEGDTALVVSHIERSDSGVELLYFSNLAGATEFADNRRGYLTWTKPEQKRIPSFQVEGVDVFPGDTVYYYGINKDGWGATHTVKKDGHVVHQRSGHDVSVEHFVGGTASFRLKPMLVIGDQLVPMPVREAPAKGTAYFTPNTHATNYYSVGCWGDMEHDRIWLERGLIHLTKEAAIAHAQAVLTLSKKKG